MTMGVDTLKAVFDEAYYEDLPGGLLEAMGRLFRRNLRVYAHPWRDPQSGAVETARTLRLPEATMPLFRYLIDRGSIRDIEGYDAALLDIRADEVREQIRADAGWEHAVMPGVAELIRARGLFGLGARTE
jgi:hypothetical protein